jgi:hypothetical protein
MRIYALLMLLLLAAPQAFACDCADAKPNLDQAFMQSDLVFLGKVGKIESQKDKELVTFEVRRRWKGIDKENSITLQTSLEVFSCDYSFVEGTEYLVFATLPPKEEKTETNTNLFQKRLPKAEPVIALAHADYCGLTAIGDSDEAVGYLRALQSVESGGAFASPSSPGARNPSRSWARTPTSEDGTGETTPYIEAPKFGPAQ